MYTLSARNRYTKKWDDLSTFYDERQFYFMLNEVDYSKYNEVLILDENRNVMMYYEHKEYVSYFHPDIINKTKIKKDRKYKNDKQ